MAIYIKHNNNLSPSEVRVDVGTTSDAIYIVQRLIQDDIISIDSFNSAYLKYNTRKLPHPDPKDNAHYPLRFIGPSIELYVSGVTAGIKGSGSEGVLKLLDMFGFKYTAEQEHTVLEDTYDASGNRVEDISLFFSK